MFSPILKPEAKKSLDIETDTITLLFGAEIGDEKRKGFRELLSVIQRCLTSDSFQDLVKKEKITLLCFGHPGEQLESAGIPVVSLGYINSDEEMRTAYSAADIFVLPSLEDNLPNTILESLSCGTPVVAFDIGGVPDVIFDGVTGKLVPAYDTKKMAEAIISLIFNRTQREEMGQRGRQKMLEGYSLKTQAQNYLSLYKELIEKSSTVAISATAAEPTGQVPLDTTLGPAFRDIYDNVLLKTLMEYAPALHNRWLECEADRAARLEVIHKLDALLKECDADRAARLGVIQSQSETIQSLQTFKQELENTLSWRLTAPFRRLYEIVKGDRGATRK